MGCKKILKFLVFSFLFSTLTQASELDSVESFLYSGQSNEQFVLNNKLTETRFKTEEIPSTCYREVPYQDEECTNETRYREECHIEPGQQTCRDVPRQVCRNVTSTRRECSNTPGRQVCSTTPSRQECTTSPSRQECSTTPGTQQCHEEPAREECRVEGARRICRKYPGRRVCRTTPPQQSCRTVPGQRTCRTIPGQQTCRTEPGQQVCRDVPHTSQVCHTENDRQCSTSPSRQVCRKYPYDFPVCRTITRTRSEAYSCTKTVQTPYEVTLKNFMADLNFEFPTTSSESRVEFNVELSKTGNVKVVANDKSTIPVFVKIEKSEARSNDGQDIKANYSVEFIESLKFTSPVSKEIDKVKFERKTLSFEIGKLLEFDTVALEVSLTKDGTSVFNSRLNESQVQLVSKSASSEVSLSWENLLGEKLEKGDYELTIKVKSQMPTNVINPPLKFERIFSDSIEL